MDAQSHQETHQVLLSVLVPTRNAGVVLFSAIQSLLESGLDVRELEVLVSDNSTSPVRIPEVLAQDPRFRLVRPPNTLSMSDNWEHAFVHSRGLWVVYLGSDDAVVPGRFTDFVRTTLGTAQVDTVLTYPALFTWPGTLPDEKADDTGHLEFLLSNQRVTPVSYKRALRRSARSPWSVYRLPMPYARAVVKSTVLGEIKARQGGQLFRSATPDWYLGMAIASLSPIGVRHSGTPVFIAGLSSVSNGLSNVSADPDARLRSLEFWELDNRGGFERTGIPNELMTGRLLASEVYAASRHLRQANAGNSLRRLAISEALFDHELGPSLARDLLGRSGVTAPWLVSSLMSARSVTHPTVRLGHRARSMCSLALTLLRSRGSQVRLRALAETTIIDAAHLIDHLDPGPPEVSLRRFHKSDDASPELVQGLATDKFAFLTGWRADLKPPLIHRVSELPHGRG